MVEFTDIPFKQVINEGIDLVLANTKIDVQKDRYKAMRAIAFQAFREYIDSNRFPELVTRAIENLDDLPSGWRVDSQPSEKVAPVRARKAPQSPSQGSIDQFVAPKRRVSRRVK